MFKSTGKIIYDPYRGSMKNRTAWWCVLIVDKEITRYYRWWVLNQKGIHLHNPSWDAHVSIIRGEQPTAQLKYLWKKYHMQSVTFEYDHYPRQTGDTTGWDRPDNFWFVEVKAPKLKLIREEFGFPTSFSFHLTFGRTY